MRDDLAKIISILPASSQQHLSTAGAGCLALLNQHVPGTERITGVSPASVRFMDGQLNSVFALTEDRLLFVAPLPQTITWRLSDITSLTCNPGGSYFNVEEPGSKYSFGLDPAAGDAFGEAVILAVAVARLRDR